MNTDGHSQNTRLNALETPLDGVRTMTHRNRIRKIAITSRERTTPGPVISVWCSRICLIQQETWKAYVNPIRICIMYKYICKLVVKCQGSRASVNTGTQYGARVMGMYPIRPPEKETWLSLSSTLNRYILRKKSSAKMRWVNSCVKDIIQWMFFRTRGIRNSAKKATKPIVR